MWSAREWKPTRAHVRFLRDRPNGHLNSVLYNMCDDAPGHGDVERVRAKVIIIGRSYATGLMRHASGGEAQVPHVVVSQRRWLDREIGVLRGWSDCMPRHERIQTIARVHGRLLRALQSTTRNGNSVRSFVAKYLHFHAPVVPIFDQYAFYELGAWYRRVRVGDTPRDVDSMYWRHLVRHAWIVDNWLKVGFAVPTSRAIDDYALASWNTTT